MSRRARRRAESWALKRGRDQAHPDDPDGQDDGEGNAPDVPLDAEAWAWAASGADGGLAGSQTPRQHTLQRLAGAQPANPSASASRSAASPERTGQEQA